MRFSDLESLYQRFFLITKEGEKSQSDWWVRERIGLLRRHGFLISQRLTFTGLSYYLATEKAHIALENLYDSHGSFVRYLKQINLSNFKHDRRVLKSRVVLENVGCATNWRSERVLKSQKTLHFGLARKYQPDAIYTNKLGEDVAFELNFHQKLRGVIEKKSANM